MFGSFSSAMVDTMAAANVNAFILSSKLLAGIRSLTEIDVPVTSQLNVTMNIQYI